MRARLQLLADGDLAVMIGEALRTLERVGVKVENAAAASLLLAAGATRRDGRLLLPESLVRAALATAPATFALYDRAGAPVAELGKGRTSFNPGSAAIYRIDGGSAAARCAPACASRRPPPTSSRSRGWWTDCPATQCNQPLCPQRRSDSRRPLAALSGAHPRRQAGGHRNVHPGRLRADARHARRRPRQ